MYKVNKVSDCYPVQCKGLSSQPSPLAQREATEEIVDRKKPIDCHRSIRRRSPLLILLLCFPGLSLLAQARPDTDIQIKIEKIEQVSVIDVSTTVTATPEQTWAVLTDWDNLTSFMSNVKASSMIAQSANTVRVKQTLRARFWPFSFDIELEREIELFPYERMQFRLLGGDFDMMKGTIQLVAHPTGTRIVSHAEFIARFWIPPLIGPIMMEYEARGQFQQIIDEIARRSTAGTAAPDADVSKK